MQLVCNIGHVLIHSNIVLLFTESFLALLPGRVFISIGEQLGLVLVVCACVNHRVVCLYDIKAKTQSENEARIAWCFYFFVSCFNLLVVLQALS